MREGGVGRIHGQRRLGAVLVHHVHSVHIIPVAEVHGAPVFREGGGADVQEIAGRNATGPVGVIGDDHRLMCARGVLHQRQLLGPHVRDYNLVSRHRGVVPGAARGGGRWGREKKNRQQRNHAGNAEALFIHINLRHGLYKWWCRQQAMEFLAAIDEEILACRVELLQAEGAAPASPQKTLQELLQEQSLDINTASNAQIHLMETRALASMRKRNKAIESLDPNWRTTLLTRYKEEIAVERQLIEETRKKITITEAKKGNTSGIPSNRSVAEINREINRVIKELNANINSSTRRIDNLQRKVDYLNALKPSDLQTPPKKSKASTTKTSRIKAP